MFFKAFNQAFFTLMVFLGLSNASFLLANSTTSEIVRDVSSKAQQWRRHWKTDQRDVFLSKVFPKSTDKDRAALLKAWVSNAAQIEAFPKVVSRGQELFIGAREQVKIKMPSDPSKKEFLINGVPFVVNERMGVRYHYKLLEKHLELTLPGNSTEKVADLRILSLACLFALGERLGFWREV